MSPELSFGECSLRRSFTFLVDTVLLRFPISFCVYLVSCVFQDICPWRSLTLFISVRFVLKRVFKFLIGDSSLVICVHCFLDQSDSRFVCSVYLSSGSFPSLLAFGPVCFADYFFLPSTLLFVFWFPDLSS